MTEQLTWSEFNSRCRIVTAEPTERDLFVVTLLEGKVVGFVPAEEYRAALQTAEAFLREHNVALKVLPVTFKELLHLKGIDYAEYMSRKSPATSPEDIAFDQACIARMTQIVGNPNADPRARTDAFNLLKAVGVVHA